MPGPDRQPLLPPPAVSLRLAVVVAGLIGTQAVLLVVLGSRMSVVLDEVGHLAAGLSVWQLNRFDLYSVNPPLVRSVAAIPVALDAPQFEWPPIAHHSLLRPEWTIGRTFVETRGENWFRDFVWARSCVMPFVLIGGGVCFVWARSLYGSCAGVVALTLWCFSPSVLAWGATITPDAAAATFGVMAGWWFWCWLREPDGSGMLLAGLLLGLANLTKLTWVILFLLWPVLWAVWRLTDRTTPPERPRPTAVQLAAILMIGLLVLNAGYGFEGTLKPLGTHRFVSDAFTELAPASEARGPAASAWRDIPVPLPENWLRGIDLQKRDFEQGKWSYLRGEWRHGGWWYYYLYCAAVKIPLGCWALAALAGIDRLRGAGKSRGDTVSAASAEVGAESRCRTGWRDELVLLAPAVVVFGLVSSQTGFSRYFRYVLPCFPFAFIWISRVGRNLTLPDARTAGPDCRGVRSRLMAAGVVLALAWFVAGSLQVFPYSMSSFNLLAGGPENGHRHLLHANVDWGQDMWALKEWQDRNPQARPLMLEHASVLPPHLYGIEATGVPLRPVAGWYVISLHRLHDRNDRFRWLLDGVEPVDRIGYSMNVYHLSPEQAVAAGARYRDLSLHHEPYPAQGDATSLPLMKSGTPKS